MKILNLNDKNIVNKINKFIEENPYHDCMQTLEWLKFKPAREKYGVYIEDENNNIILYSNIFIITDGDMRKLYTSRGPICDYSDISLLNKFIKGISSIFTYDYLIMDPRIFEIDLSKLIGNPKIINDKDYFKQQYSSQNAIVDISNLDSLMSGFHQKTRYNIRKSIKSGVEFNITDEIDLDLFMELYDDTALRHHFKPHDKDYFINLLNILKDKIILCEVKCDDVVVCMGIYLKDKDKIYYLYGVSRRLFQDRMPSYMQHYGMMKYGNNEGYKYYDFGGVFCSGDDTENPDYGLYKFKLGFCRNFINYVGEIEFDLNLVRG